MCEGTLGGQYYTVYKMLKKLVTVVVSFSCIHIIFICLKEFRAYYVIPPGVRLSIRPSVGPSVRPSVSNLVSGA